MNKLQEYRIIYNNSKIYKDIIKLSNMINKIGMTDNWIFFSSDGSFTSIQDKENKLYPKNKDD